MESPWNLLDGCSFLQSHGDIELGGGISPLEVPLLFLSYSHLQQNSPHDSLLHDPSLFWDLTAVKSSLYFFGMTFGGSFAIPASPGWVQTNVFLPPPFCLVLVQMRSCLVLPLIIPQLCSFLSCFGAKRVHKDLPELNFSARDWLCLSVYGQSAGGQGTSTALGRNFHFLNHENPQRGKISKVFIPLGCLDKLNGWKAF